MNIKALKAAEKEFLRRYPRGFKHPEMVEMGKKHKMEQLERMANDGLAKKNFDDPNLVLSEVAKLVSRSTMISMFEKPKFKTMVSKLTKKEREIFAEGFYELLHGREKVGFELLISDLEKRQLAKWTLATVVQSYYRPQKDVFVKPTTTKLVIEVLDLDLKYNARPTWDFYRRYRKDLMEMKGKVSKTLSPNNPAFTGFLMMSLGQKS